MGNASIKTCMWSCPVGTGLNFWLQPLTASILCALVRLALNLTSQPSLNYMLCVSSSSNFSVMPGRLVFLGQPMLAQEHNTVSLLNLKLVIRQSQV